MTDVTIVLRTCDRSMLLKRALQDVANQTFADWKLIVMDDGVEINAGEAVTEQFGEDERVVVKQTGGGVGCAKALNLAMPLVETKYMAFHDDDDTWHPEFLERTMGWLDQNPDALGVATKTDIVYEELIDEEYHEVRREPFWADVTQFSAMLLMRMNRHVPISVVLSVAGIKQVGGFRGDLPVVDDWDMNLKLALAGNLGFLADQPLAFWHHRPQAAGADGNTMYKQAADHLHWDRVVREEYVKEYVEQHGIGGILAINAIAEEHVNHLNGRLDHLEHMVGRLQETVESLSRSLGHVEESTRQVAKQSMSFKAIPGRVVWRMNQAAKAVANQARRRR